MGDRSMYNAFDGGHHVKLLDEKGRYCSFSVMLFFQGVYLSKFTVLAYISRLIV